MEEKNGRKKIDIRIGGKATLTTASPYLSLCFNISLHALSTLESRASMCCTPMWTQMPGQSQQYITSIE
jgi:hypothetical protein